MLNLGNQTVVLVTIGEDTGGPRDAFGQPLETRVETPIGNVRFRMVSSTEDTDLGNRIREIWKLTASPSAALLAATGRGHIEYQDDVYSITGTPRVVLDMQGVAHHVSIACERYLG